jgi:hypothetical protein
VEIDSQGTVISMPTKEAEKEGIYAWDRIIDGKVVCVDDN